MVEFTFGDDAEMIAEGIFIVADKHPSIGELIRCRDAGIFIRHHGLEREPGYHILRIAKDVEKMINNMDRFDIMFGDVPLVDFVPKGITDEDEWGFCLLALAVAADHHGNPCTFYTYKTKISRPFYTPEKPPFVPFAKRKGCKP
jgi:RecJ-like exonuclease